MTELEVAAFRRDCTTLAGHVRGGLRGDGFGETARQALDKLVTLAYGAAGMGEETPFRDLLPEDKARVDELTRLMDMSWQEVIVLLLRRACPEVRGAPGPGPTDGGHAD